MREAIAEALKAKGQTGENPIVGAVIAENGQIVARGHHQFFGGPHAEIECLKAFRESSQFRTTNLESLILYVTLEPCSTVGKTGKCTDAIIASGIKKVVVGAIDPNPAHRGEGIKVLQKAGVEVTSGILAEECEELNPDFNHRMNAASTACYVPRIEGDDKLINNANSAVLFDTHCHIYYDDFDSDREAMLCRAREAGVKYMVNVGVDVPISQICLEYARKYDFIFASAGIHPNDAVHAKEEDFHSIEKMLAQPKVVALGEVGLDFYRDTSSQESQEKVFLRFLEMYQRVQKPLILHCRDAFPRLIEILEEFSSTPYRGIFHCFSGDRKIMENCLKLGFHISFAGPLTYRRNDELREACKACPDNRILIETDCPYLPPQSMRGKRNEPALMVETAKVAAEVRGVGFEDFARQSTQNALELFQLC